MALLSPDLTTRPSPAPLQPPLQPLLQPTVGVVHGGLIATYRQLRTVFGDHHPILVAGWTVSVPGWAVHTPVGPCVLFDPDGLLTPGQRPDELLRWQVCSADARPLPWLCKVLHGSTSGLPHSAQHATIAGPVDGSEVDLPGLTLAYVDYLYLRGRAVHAHLQHLDPAGADYQEHRRLPPRFLTAAVALCQVWLHHRFTSATPAQRHSWLTSPRPTRGLMDTDLQHWHAIQRWLYTPTNPQPRHSERIDLPGMVADLAAHYAIHRKDVWPNLTAAQQALWNEHEATLWALAAIPLTDDTAPAGGAW
jgi:hypothetical protein